ncbi:hypothetical protein [Rhizobium sp. BK456]|uniref:hypothetical protein n=1 Tax=Rhizobium sp. BK456 TaxID=2587007 RepID=UPI00184BB915|nr:hypothetical protein [Rhizobium sp. BK456]MBB3523089.1 hypothetical protein [Rhizobium sp. BK456]
MKMIAGLSGSEFSLSPGDEYEFDDDEAGRLIAAGFAEKAGAEPAPTKTKKGKANVVSTEGNASAD